MKKYIHKFSRVSSTTKLFFFIFILMLVVIFASSGIFIQYKDRQKLRTTGLVEPIATAVSAKLEAVTVVNSTPDKPEDSSDKNQAAKPLSSASEIALVASCETQTLKSTILFKDAPWLPVGQTSIAPGEDGYINSCPGGDSSTKQPQPQIVYRGTKPNSEPTSPSKRVVGRHKAIKS